MAVETRLQRGRLTGRCCGFNEPRGRGAGNQLIMAAHRTTRSRDTIAALLSRHLKDAKLAHHVQLVGDAPVLDDLALRHPLDRHGLDTQLLARGRYAKEFRLPDEFDRKREQLRRRDFAHIKGHELLQVLLEDKTSYGETFFVPPREYMSAALRLHSSSDFSRQGQQLLDEQAERIGEAGSVVAGARSPPVVYHGPVLGRPRAIAKPRYGDTSGGA